MRINVIAIGKRMPAWVTEGYQDYVMRFPADFPIRLIEISAGKRTKGANISRLIQQEGEQMNAAIPAGDQVVALTEKGQLWSTSALSKQMQSWQDAGGGLSFLIGGPEGLAASSLARAQWQWSLSPLTFPHPLVRILLVEQLYRGLSILRHHPYHRG